MHTCLLKYISQVGQMAAIHSGDFETFKQVLAQHRKECKEREWGIVKDTEEHNIKWLGNKVIRIMNYITDNKEENYLNFFFSFMTDYKGYYEINNISVLLHTKEPSSTIIEIKNVSNSIGISLN